MDLVEKLLRVQATIDQISTADKLTEVDRVYLNRALNLQKEAVRDAAELQHKVL